MPRSRSAALWTTALAIAATSGIGYTAPTTTIEQQRQAFREVYPAVERGDWTAVGPKLSLLEDYVLWPDLRATYLRMHLRDRNEAEVAEFLKKYGTLKPARELRYRFALQLASENKHTEFLLIYDQFYEQLGEAKLDCLALDARIALGQQSEIETLARPLWLVGRSQVEECDPVFAHLSSSGLLTADWYRERYELATKAQQFSLARFLGRSIDADHVAEANRWLDAQNSPTRFLGRADPKLIDPVYRDQLAYAARKIAFQDPVKASDNWKKIVSQFEFSPDQLRKVDRHIALWAARHNLGVAVDFLAGLADDAVDDEVVRWRIRVSLRQQNWPAIPSHVDDLSISERQREEWHYWKAVALEKTGASAESMLIFSTLAEKRNYYGFLAADHLGLEYSFAHVSLENDNAVIQKLSGDPAMIRALELYKGGLDGRGRSEWDAATKNLAVPEKRQAAILADQWGWHSRAIATVAQIGQFDDLELRYPLPHRESFENYSADASIQESWAYGVARNESLFMRDIRSSAGAVGVMQLMPETGRRAAREISHPYKGRNTLTDANSNIRLGTFYLGEMHKRFNKNAVLATAAYNAGPRRVEQWLPASESVDARIWIENIPFNETRKYVRRVLASEAIFSWRLTGKSHRISDHLGDIGATGNPPSVAGY